MGRFLACALTLAVALSGMTSSPVAAAPDEVPAEVPAEDRWIHTTPTGYRCEMNLVMPLGKGVCRRPGNFNDYYVIFFDFDERTQVFLDGFQPAGRGQYVISQEQMSFDEFYRRFGR
jgi:hypothetical protein